MGCNAFRPPSGTTVPYYLKKIIYEMRFDEVSAVYGEFGDFLVGICLEPKQVFERR